MKLFLPLLILLMSFIGHGQTRKSVNNLKLIINQYAAQNIRHLNATGGMGKYQVKAKNTFYSDVDGDGDFDAVVEMIFCEKTSCHPTTQSSKLAVFANTNNKYKLIAERGFQLFGKINSIDGSKIYIDVYDIGEDDPQCCPELKKHETYSFSNGKLIRLKN